jgi:hypothetical protein
MELRIDERSSFQSVQGQFTALYPFLRIEERAGRFARNSPPLTVHVGGHRTVSQVVRDFEEILGLSVGISRKSGSLWIETSLTADWTLEQQNREGEHITLMG